MLKNKIFMGILFVIVLSLLALPGSTLAQKTCVFISKAADPGDSRDSTLIEHLKQTYDVARIVGHGELADGVVTVDDLKQYDFGFVSESVGTWAIAGPLKGNPIPLFFTEGYAAKPGISGWASSAGVWGSTYDSTATGGKVTIVDDTGHQLAAGFANGAEVDIVTASDPEKDEMLTYCVPEIDYTPIAVWSEDPTKSVVFGVETGTALFLDDGSAIDPTVLSENRAAAVCIHANANNFISEDGYKLIDAGIQWILGEEGGPTEDFVNTPIDPQTGVFVATFNAKATADSVDGVFGLAKNEPASYDDYSCKVLFSNAGIIKASNGSSFAADSAVTYVADQTFAVKLLVNIPDQTYSIWVTPDGGNEITIGKNFAFGPKAGVVESLNYYSVKMSFHEKWGGAVGVVEVTDFAISLSEDFINTAIEPQTGRFMTEFNAVPTADKVDGVLALSKGAPASYGDFRCKILFNNQGFITANNGGSFEALNDLAYEAGKTYAVKQIVDIPAQTFSVWITPEGGEQVAIGENFAFQSKDGVVVDELNYRSVKMSFGLPWGGAEGFVEVTDFTISDAPQSDMKTCVFIGSGTDPGASVDSTLIAHLRKTYDVARIVDDDSAMTGAFSIDDLKQYDFAFISESASTWRLSSAPENFYKVAPIPMFYTELYSGKPAITGWCSAEGFWDTAKDSINKVGKVIVVDETNHPLCCGFQFGDEVDIVTGTDDPSGGVLTYCMPEVDYIPIAVWADDPMMSVVFGVEAGTALWDDLGLAIDPALVSQNRTAAVGIYAAANDYITEDGYKLIDAGINWILDTGTAVEKQTNEVPVSFELSQNYPNPFNPSTEIVFSLAKPGRTTLSVYNVLGQVVETLVDQDMAVGTYRFSFDAKNIPSGIYFYQLQSGELKQMKKMMLMK